MRALLAILVLDANEVVSRDTLIDGLWGERPPPSAGHTLDDYISRLRKLLGPDRIETRPPGYVLQLDPGELDLGRFELLVEQGHDSLARGDSQDAAETLRAALALWRGAALADVLYAPFASTTAEQLEERRVSALEARIDADLACGGSAELVAELEGLVRKNPLRERLLGQLMLAIYRSGRQANALDVLRAGRQRLVGELGLEPGPQLRKLEREILEQDPALDAPATTRPGVLTNRKRGWRNLTVAGATGVAGVAVVASTVVVLLLVTGRTQVASGEATSSQVVALTIGSGELSRGEPLQGAPVAMAADRGSIWLAQPDAGVVSRVALATGAVVDRIPVENGPGALAVGGGSLWVASVPGGVVLRIDTTTEQVTQTVGLGGARATALAYGRGGLWIADTIDSALVQLDPITGAVRRVVELHLRPTALAIGGGAIWVADYDSNAVAEVDLRSGQTVSTVHVGNGPAALAVGEGAVWVANSLDSTVSRVDPSTGTVEATIPVGSGPSAVAVAEGSVWTANQYSATVSRIDVSRNVAASTTRVSGRPTTLMPASGKLWVGIRPLDQRRGGTLTLLSTQPISIDPALQLNLRPPQADGLTRDGLVTYNHVGGPAGVQLVPDLAIRLPTPTDGGTTYTFRLRPGIRYSDGRPLRARDFRRSFERLFALRSGASDAFTGVLGGAACATQVPAECDLTRGIVTDDAARTVTFHLRAPDSDFLSKLTIGGLATPVPVDTPLRPTGFTPIPGTGPYKIASASKNEIRYVRNPYFHEWSHAAQPDGNPDEIVMRFGLSPGQEVLAIKQGRADWMADAVPARLVSTLRVRFASQLHTFPTTETDFFQINTALAPFNDVRVRQALNLALDRRVIVSMYGGRALASPTCQVLPPGVPGYRSYCPYTRDPNSRGVWRAPDLDRARRLVAASNTRGSRITVWGWTDDPTISPRVVRYTARVLRDLDYRVRVRLVPHAYFDSPPPSIFRSIQLIPAGWLNTTAANFFVTWLSCKGAITNGMFCVPSIDREIESAQALASTNPRAAAALWARIDRQTTDLAAWVPLVNAREIDFVSARVRNYQHHPYWGILADQVSLR